MKPTTIEGRKANEREALDLKITAQLGYSALEEFIEEFGEVDEFHNINQAILAFLGEDQ